MDWLSNSIFVTSLEDYISNIEFFPETAFYRGHSDIKYRLIPSVGRMFKEGNESALLQYERSIFESFKRNLPLYSNHIPKNDKECLFLAQHYGLPTRLLDWTYNPLIALYFACKSNNLVDGIVYVGLPSRYFEFNENNQDILSFDKETILLPNLTDVRYKNQNGLFAYFPKPWQENSYSIQICKSFRIPAAAKSFIIKKLFTIGISESFIMPSLDSLCKDIIYSNNLKYQSYMP